MIVKLLLVALGGAAGSVARFGVGLALPFPPATVVINIVGSSLIGLVWTMLDPRWHPLLMVGVLGGFTTFSAFSLETLRLVEMGRMGHALAYVGASVILSLFACWLGMSLGRALA